MLRTLRYFVFIAIFILGAAWFADQPGSVSVQWAGYQIDTSFAVLSIVIAGISIVVALVYRLWMFIVRVPGNMGLAWQVRRRNKGFAALTKGMVAVAAGDSDEARRQARRAEGILSDPPLTMLLSAQAAQLNGDERAAERFFKAMTGNKETEFLGLRGLLNQAMARGDTGDAIALARQAHRLKPDSKWVSQSLFELQTRSALWLDASVTVREAARNKHLGSDSSNRRQAVLSFQISMVAEQEGDIETALKHARHALSKDDTLLPAILGVVRAWIKMGRQRKAGGMIEKAWKRLPHPDLVALYKQVRNTGDVLAAVKTAERLAGFNPGHVESALAVARAALDADLWGQARQRLEPISVDEPSARICRMMAELEEAEHGNLTAARQWLMQASLADPDPAYVCGDCGHTVRDWHVMCDNCQGFDRYEWRVPAHAVDLGRLLESQKNSHHEMDENDEGEPVVLIEHDTEKSEGDTIKLFSSHEGQVPPDK